MINGVSVGQSIQEQYGGGVIGLGANCDCCNADVGGAVDSIALVI